MKNITLLLFIILSFLASSAQDTWTIKHNKIEILNTGKSDPVQNVIAINKSDLNLPGALILTYNEIKTQKNWIRYLVVYDDSENIIIQKKGGTVLKLTNESLKKILLKNSIVKIYTWSLPADPKRAAGIRVRRLHLCTIELK